MGDEVRTGPALPGGQTLLVQADQGICGARGWSHRVTVTAAPRRGTASAATRPVGSAAPLCDAVTLPVMEPSREQRRPDGEQTDVRRLSATGVALRVVGTVAALGVLAYGQVADTNDLFPLGTLSQFATPRDLDGTIRSTYLLADTATEDEQRVAMNKQTIGVARAEVEGQLQRILDNPELMQSLIDAHAALKPDLDAIETLYLMRSIQQLEDGYVVGEPEKVEVLRWDSTAGED